MAVVLLLVLLVAGVALLLLWLRRKRTAKVVLQKVPTTALSNPVYEGEWGSECKNNRVTRRVIHELSVTCGMCCAGCAGRTNGIAIHGTITNSAVQSEETYESPYSQYDSVTNGEPPPPRKETLAEFDNPLYSDTGPVTVSETTPYETVSLCCF